MELSELAASVRDALTVRRVFGDPYERDGVTVIPVATVRGGAGGGKAPKEGSEGKEGEGGGIGLIAKPAGAYVIRGEEVKWQPAVDLNRIVAGGQLVALTALLVVGRLLSLRRRRGDRSAG